jgi:glycosyltransferase involved in cell wall biosynthesis
VKILHVITTIEVGGAEKHLVLLTELQRKHGHDVEVIFLKGAPSLLRDFEKNDVLINQSIANQGILKQVFKILWTIKRNKYSIAHGHLPRSELILAFISAFTRVPIVITKHNSEPMCKAVTPFLNALMAKFVSMKTDGIIYISNAAFSSFEKRKEISKSEINRVIYYGVHLRSSGYEPFKATMGFKKKCITLSRLTSQKNLDLLITAFSNLDKNLYSLDIYGEGELQQQLEDLIVNLKLSDQVKIHPKVQRIEQVLKEHDVFILASKYEGFGLVLLEAIEAGLPIVASKASSILEVLGENYEYLFNPNSLDSISETIKKLLTSKTFLYGDYLRNRLSAFDSEKMCIETLEFYKEILEA